MTADKVGVSQSNKICKRPWCRSSTAILKTNPNINENERKKLKFKTPKCWRKTWSEYMMDSYMYLHVSAKFGTKLLDGFTDGRRAPAPRNELSEHCRHSQVELNTLQLWTNKGSGFLFGLTITNFYSAFISVYVTIHVYNGTTCIRVPKDQWRQLRWCVWRRRENHVYPNPKVLRQLPPCREWFDHNDSTSRNDY